MGEMGGLASADARPFARVRKVCEAKLLRLAEQDGERLGWERWPSERGRAALCAGAEGLRSKASAACGARRRAAWLGAVAQRARTRGLCAGAEGLRSKASAACGARRRAAWLGAMGAKERAFLSSIGCADGLERRAWLLFGRCACGSCA